MKIIPIAIALTGAAIAAFGSDAHPETRVLIPLTPVAQTHSVAMLARLDELRTHDVLTTLEQRTRLTALPPWVLDPKAREIAFVIPSPLLPDAFRHALILGTNGGVIVIRAGGLQDAYEVFNACKNMRTPPPVLAHGPPSSRRDLECALARGAPA